MTEKFTASNGVDVESGKFGKTHLYRTDLVDGRLSRLKEWDFLDVDDMEALEEYFLAKRDKELGRWRWPENPNWLVYWNEEDSNEVIVFDESDPAEGGVRITRGEDRDWPHFQPAAQAYFAAHPEPRPWLDAKPGEVWIFEWTLGSKQPALILNNGKFVLRDNDYSGKEYSLEEPAVKAGHRIYPGGETND